MKVAIIGLLLTAATVSAEEVHPAIHCNAMGIQFVCVATGIDGINATPEWTFYKTPLDGGYGPVYTSGRDIPKVWTRLEFTISDEKNDVRLQILVRQHDGKAQFAAADTEAQHVEK